MERKQAILQTEEFRGVDVPAIKVIIHPETAAVTILEYALGEYKVERQIELSSEGATKLLEFLTHNLTQTCHLIKTRL